MSTFSGISTALSSLIAQRQALDVAGQNIANANTPGYTRQRAEMTALQSTSGPSMFSTPRVAGNGVKVTSIERLGDVFLDARLRAESSTAGYVASRAEIYAQLESGINEPSDTGIARALQDFWAGWQDVANRPDDLAARSVLLENARSLASRISAGHRAVSTQWEQVRSQAASMVSDINMLASAIADLNDRISTITGSGGSANELIDQRELFITQLADLAGASARHRDDGTVDVMVGGNALVRGASAYGITLSGSATLVGLPGDEITIEWAHGGSFTVDGGRLAGHLSALAPASAGGILAGAAESYNTLAQTLADSVNAIHQTGTNIAPPPAGPATGLDFFAIDPALPAALGLRIAPDITGPADIAAADAALGALDGSIADAIALVAQDPTGPDAVWSTFVVDLGVTVRTATHRAEVAESARATAERLQLANASVDLDEETINMLAFQRAYEGAARVLTAIDEMLDVLINRTGVVGR